MKKLLFAGLLSIVTLVANAQSGYYQTSSPKQIINSTVGLTNQGVLPNGVYPSSITAGTSVTNVVPFAVPGKDVAIQFNLQVLATSGAAATNVVVQLGRSVMLPSQMPAGGVTNAAGTGLNIEWFGTMTNTIPGGTTAGTTVVAHALFGPITGQSSAAADGGMSTFYIGYITAPAGTTVTNYSFWVNGL